MDDKNPSTVTITYELFAGIAISDEEFEKLEAQIRKICEIHDSKHTVNINVKNQYVRN